MTVQTHSQQKDIRTALREAVAHLEHSLPGQASIREFVHHNTLHGYQHLEFAEALEAARKLTGARGYLPEERYRELLRQGRITRVDLEAVLLADRRLDAAETITDSGLQRKDIYLVSLLHPLRPVTGCQLCWQVEEMRALERFQDDVAPQSRQRLLERHVDGGGAGDERTAIGDLWSACLHALGLEHFILHPEELVELSPQQAERMLANLAASLEGGDADAASLDRLLIQESDSQLDALLSRVGEDLTLRGLLLALTGRDLLDELKPLLIRQLASHLDQGMAAWHGPARESGFYASWRRMAAADPAWIFEEMPDWQDNLEFLPESAIEAVIAELQLLGLPQSRWITYIERAALELPGWSGMFLWRHMRPGYDNQAAGVDMMDYLAVRLVLERLYAQRLAREIWRIEPSLDGIRWHFRHHRSEFLVRHALFDLHLPEYLVNRAQHLTTLPGDLSEGSEHWAPLARMIWTWRQSPAAAKPGSRNVFNSAWPLFRLSQHLGLCAGEVRDFTPAHVDALFETLERADEQQRCFIWLQAYENHYRDQVLGGLAENFRRRAEAPGERPQAQLVFCMDDREEGFRRHLEEIYPQVETFGAAAHFNVPHNWRGLGDSTITPLTPVVYVPVHEIREEAQAGCEALAARHARRISRRRWLRDLLHQEIRRNLLTSVPLILLAAPGALLALIGKSFAPLLSGRLLERLRRGYDLVVPTRLSFCAPPGGPEPTPEQPRLGFTDDEQLARAELFLRNIGLVRNFAPLVVIMAHGSSSQNNPHLSAYDCGACSGNHSGPNARILAAILNRPEIRRGLAERGIGIPSETWFLGGEHNTCTDLIEWYDTDRLPESLQSGFGRLVESLDEAQRRHAHERCRKFASAPASPSLRGALEHIIGRATDFSQARPELGHATNASAFIGRRSATRGVFYDRRMFLISYDSTTDERGEVLERLLLANGPVGAGINLEYYFSTVDNEQYGAGSKVTHNVTGLLGVLDGASGDLRTGLPKQMIEIHEPMRLLVVVEASQERLGTIYQRQPALQELIGNGWLLLAAMDPDSGALATFDPRSGFVPWRPQGDAIPVVAHSRDWYAGIMDPLPPALVRQESAHA